MIVGFPIIMAAANESFALNYNSTLSALNLASEILLSFTKFLVFLAIILLLFLIAIKILQKERGIIVMPFDTFSGNQKEKHNGKAISYLMTYELYRISNIHNHRISPIPMKFPPQSTYWGFDGATSDKSVVGSNPTCTRILEERYDERIFDMMPQSETLEYCVNGIGTIKTGILEISLGSLLSAFKKLLPLPDEYGHDIINGSFQENESYLNIVAYLEGRDIYMWKASEKISGKDDLEDHIHFMIKNLAYQIAHQLSRRDYGPEDRLRTERVEGTIISTESWLAWKYYTDALEAYQEFARSKSTDHRNKAKECCSRSLKIDKGYDKPLKLLFVLGFSYLDNEEDRKVAWEIFECVRKSKSELAALAASGLGILNLTIRNYKEALDYFKESIELNPRDSLIWFGKGMAQEGLANEKTAFEIPAGNADPFLYDPGLFYSSQDQELKESLEAYDKAIEINSTNYEAYYHKGLVHCKMKEFDEALKDFMNALEIDPENAEIWYHKGIALSQIPKFEEAIESYNEVIKIDPLYLVGYANERKTHPHVAFSWLYKGVSLSKLGRYDEADQAYSKALEIDSAIAVAWYYKGMNLGKLGNYHGARDAFKQAADKKKDYPSARFMNLFLSAFCYLSNSPELALSAADGAFELVAKNEALKQYSKNSALPAMKGIALSRSRNYEDALKCFEEAIKLDPESAFIWNRKHFALKALGRDNEGRVASATAVKLGYIALPRFIKVHFKKEFIHADQDLVVIDSIWQGSEVDPSHNLRRDNEEHRVHNDSVIFMNEGYTLLINSIDTAAKRVRLLLMKDDSIIDSTMLGDNLQYTYEYPNMAIEDSNYLRSSRGFLSTFLI
jgi:tetratricopeptide (TPR) repeat protein